MAGRTNDLWGGLYAGGGGCAIFWCTAALSGWWAGSRERILRGRLEPAVFDNRKGLIGRTRLLHMRWGGNKSRQGERETRLDADAKAPAILICRN